MTSPRPEMIERLLHDGDSTALLDGERAHTWHEFVQAGLAWRACFLQHGLSAGSHAAVLLSNRLEYFEVLLGAVLAGVWLTPLNRHLTQAELEYIMEDAGAEILVSEPQWMSGPSAPRANCPVIEVTSINGSATSDTTPQAALAAAWADPAGGFLMYTSGTTGRPKGVKRAAPAAVGDALASWTAFGRSIGLGKPGRHLVCGPVYHAAPGFFAFYDLLGGASLVIQQGFEAEAFCEAVEVHQITRTHLVPTMFVRLLRQRQDFRRDYDLDSLELVLHGAAPVSPAVKQQMILWCGNVIVEYWGGSESGVITRIDSKQWLAHEGSVGAPLPQFELSARNDQFEELAEGEVGVLWTRHRQLSQPFSYYRDPDKTASAYHGDWFTLGDMGYLDSEGFVYLADRRSNLIISGGVNIYPAEVESVLLEHRDIMDVAIVGLDDEEWGKRVHALVQLRSGVKGSDCLRDAILQMAAEKLARFKLPRSLEFVAQLPRVDSGKLYRSRL